MRKILLGLVFSMAALVLAPSQFVSAATTLVTGGSNGPGCNDGGYFTPSAVTISYGDTITFSVPSNDPYAGGVQVNGFLEGSFVVARGGNHTTQALHANVSYYGTWPSAPSCLKGSGTVTVQAAPSPPPPPPTPPPPAPPPASPTPKTNPTPTPPPTSTNPTSSGPPSSPTVPVAAASHPSQTEVKKPAMGLAKTTAFVGTGLLILSVTVFTIWRLVRGARAPKPPVIPPPA